MNRSCTLTTNPAFPRHQRLAALVAERLPVAELAHDALHIERVYGWSLRLAQEMDADGDLAGAAALVHDCVTIAKDSVQRPLGGERSAAAARDLLLSAGYHPGDCARIIEAVRTCSWSRGLAASELLGVILQDADRLDALGVTGLMRAATCAQEMAGRTRGRLYHAADPAGHSNRQLNDALAMLDHLECKLLHLADSLHCPSARREGARRHNTLCHLRDELLHELAGIHPAIDDHFAGLLFDSTAP